jgi:hypothetical protein
MAKTKASFAVKQRRWRLDDEQNGTRGRTRLLAVKTEFSVVHECA